MGTATKTRPGWAGALARAALCLLLALAMLLSMCLPSISLLGLGGGTEEAWADEETSEEPEDPDDGEETNSETSTKKITSPSYLSRNLKLTMGQATIKSVSKLTWYTTGYTYLYLVNNSGSITCKDRINDGKVTVPCSGWAKYKLSFHLQDAKGGWDDTGTAVLKDGTVLTGSNADRFDSGRHSVDVKLSLEEKKGTIGELKLASDSGDVKMKSDVGTLSSNKNLFVITPIEFTYTMPSADQIFGRAMSNPGDSKTTGYDSIVEPAGVSHSKGYVSHRLGWAKDNGGAANCEEYSPLNMTQKAADAGGSVTLYATVNAASAGLRTSTLWADKNATSIKGYNRNTKTWLMASTRPVSEQLSLDLNGGTIKTPAGTSLYRNGTNTEGAKVSGKGKTYLNGTKLVVQNPTKKNYVFAGWKWVKPEKGAKYISGKDSYDGSKHGGKVYAKQASWKTTMDSPTTANKYVLDTSTIEGRVYDEASEASTDWEAALKANTAATKTKTPTTITVDNGFNGTEAGGTNQSKQSYSRIGTARATYQAQWVPKGLSVTYHVGKKVNGVITSMTEVATFAKKAGEAMGDAKKKPGDYGAAKGWYSDEKCTTKKDVPDTMGEKSLNFYAYSESGGDGDNPGSGTTETPDLEEAEKGTARVYYIVDGEKAGDYTVVFSSKYGTGDGSNTGQVGVRQQGIVSYSANSVRKYNRDGKWDVAKAKFSGTYQQATDSPISCNHTTSCSHWVSSGYWDSYSWTDSDGNTHSSSYWVDTSHWEHSQDYVHDGGGSPGRDSMYKYGSSQSVSSSCQSGSGVDADLGHLADKGSSWRYANKSTKFKWFDKDGSAASTSISLKSGETVYFYAYTEHDVTYTVNDPKGYEKGDTPSGKREWTHRELYTFMEDPTAIGPDEGSECASGTDTKFRGSELPAPYAEFSGWYKDPSCSGDTVDDPEKVGTNALHYYGYTTHEVKWYGNPTVTGDTPARSEEIRYGFDTGESSKSAVEDVKSSISDDEDRYEMEYWHKDTNGKPNDFDKGGRNSDGSEGAVPNLTFTCITFHDGHFIMDNGTGAERDWRITELGGERVKAGTTQKCPTGSYVSGKVTLPNCEDWATHAAEDGLVPNQWFMDDAYTTKTDTVTIDGDDWGTRYSYNANYLTMDFTKYAKGLDKSLEGKYQLFKEKVERKTEHSAKQLGSLRDYLESTKYEACRSCSHTESSKLYKGGSERISNHHLYKYEEEADVPRLPACYWLNDSKLNNAGYNKGDQLLSRNARNPEGGAYTDEGAKGGMVGTSYTVRGNTVLYLDYVQGLYDGVITG